MKKLFTVLLTLGFVIATTTQSNAQAVKIERMPIDNVTTQGKLSPVNVQQKSNVNPQQEQMKVQPRLPMETEQKNQIFLNNPDFPVVQQPNTQSDDPRAIITVLPNNNFFTAQGRCPIGSRLFINSRYIITASEMATSGFSGVVSSVGWSYIPTSSGQGPASALTTGNLKIYLKDTVATATSVSTSTVDIVSGFGGTLVYNSTYTLPVNAADFSVDVNTNGAYSYTPGNAVLVLFVYETTTAISTPLGAPWPSVNANGPTNCATLYQSQTVNGTTGAFQVNRPETRFGSTLVDAIRMGPVYSLGKAAICPCPDTNLLYVNMFHLEAQLDTVIVTTTVKNAVGGATKFSFEDTIITSLVERWVIGYLYPKGSEVCKLDSIITVGRVKRAENITGNNRAVWIKKSTLNDWNQAQPTGLVDGGVGFTGATGDFVADFYTSCEIPICAVDLTFLDPTTGNQPYNVLIYASDNDTLKPGALLFTSPGLISPPLSATAQRLTYKLPTEIMVGPGYYFVGVKQSSTVNLAYGFQTESPIRFGTFFYASPAGSNAWVDFADAGADFILDIGVRSHADMQMKVFTEGFYQGNGVMIADTMSVVIKSATTKKTVDSAKAFVGSNGVGNFKFCLVNCDSNYYWNVRHRTSISTFSNLTQKFDLCNESYNFTDAANKAFGSNQVQYPNDNNAITFTMYTGNPNQDACIDAGDISLIDNDAFNFVSGYVNTDVNGNGSVDVIDLAIADNNAFNFVCVAVP